MQRLRPFSLTSILPVLLLAERPTPFRELPFIRSMELFHHDE